MAMINKLSKRLFSRKGPQIKEMLQNQKSKIDESDLDKFTLLSKQPEIFEKFIRMKSQTQNDQSQYRQGIAIKALNACLMREFKSELKDYKVHKKVSNLICDMGFLLSENTIDDVTSKYHKLIKQTPTHMIVVTYKLRRRLLQKQKNAVEDFATDVFQLQGETFGDFMRKYGLMPPEYADYNEKQAYLDHQEEMKDPSESIREDPNDQTYFEITVINKLNQGLIADCVVEGGEIQFNKFWLLEKDASDYIGDKKQSWTDKNIFKSSNKFYNQYKGPKFMFLSEPLQNGLIEYIFSLGLRPEIGLCVEFLSWNKEQRLYMAWLRDLYLFLNKDQLDKEQTQFHKQLRV